MRDSRVWRSAAVVLVMLVGTVALVGVVPGVARAATGVSSGGSSDDFVANGLLADSKTK